MINLLYAFLFCDTNVNTKRNETVIFKTLFNVENIFFPLRIV